jgi:cell division protein FtsB
MVELRSLQKKHTEATDKMKEQIKDLTNELAELKARNEEEV